jgi:hypothetical protein
VYTGAGLIQITNSTATTGTQMAITANGLTTGHGLTITSSGTMTTTGDLLAVVASGATTSTGIVRVTANALTTGAAMLLTSSSTDTSARAMLQITNSAAAANAAIPLSITQAGVQNTNYRRIIKETATGITLWWGNGTTANGTLSGTAGDVLLNGGSNKPEYCTATTSWTALV